MNCFPALIVFSKQEVESLARLAVKGNMAVNMKEGKAQFMLANLKNR